MARQRYQVFDAVVPQARPPAQMGDNTMHMQSHNVYDNQKPYMMSAPHPMDPRGQMMSGNGVPPTYPPMYPPQQGMEMEMQGQYPNPYSYQPYDVRSAPSGQSAPLSASTSRQNRRAQQAARNSQKAIASQKRKITTPSLPSEDDAESESDGEVPDGQNPSAADIARNKYNHVEDEKERKRLKRLLRNRVSAQQARERKKAYMGNLEDRLRSLESRNEELEERANTLEKENSMLRQLLKTQTSKAL